MLRIGPARPLSFDARSPVVIQAPVEVQLIGVAIVGLDAIAVAAPAGVPRLRARSGRGNGEAHLGEVVVKRQDGIEGLTFHHHEADGINQIERGVGVLEE